MSGLREKLLSEMKVRDKGVVVRLTTTDKNQTRKLISLGVIPGVSVMLLQRFPAFVFRIGQSEFAVDKNMAQAICVRLVK